MGKHTVNIPDWRPATLNNIMSGHWSKGAKLKKADKRVIAATCRGIPSAECKRRVSLEIFTLKGKRICDPDAFWKTTLDALVHCKLLVNDTPDYVELGDVVQHKYKKGEWSGTTIVLEDVE